MGRSILRRTLLAVVLTIGVLISQFDPGTPANANYQKDIAYLPAEDFLQSCYDRYGIESICIVPRRERYDAGAIWAGDKAYVFGGTNRQHRYSQVVKYVPNEGATAVARLTNPVSNAATVWDSRKGGNTCSQGCAYIFGGLGGGGAIYRFDPAVSESSSGGAITKAGSLPTGLWGTAGAFDGMHIYLFGGDKGVGDWTNTILRYTPGTQQVTTMKTTLPALLTDSMAVWATHPGGCELGCVYVVGGRRFGGYGPHIIRYIPAFDGLPGSITFMATIPPRWRTSSVWDGRYIYIFGGLCQVPREQAQDPEAQCLSYLYDGYWGNRAWDTIMRYDPILDQLSMVDRLPRGHWGAPATCNDNTVHLFGGSYETWEASGGEIGDYFRAESDGDMYFTSGISQYILPSSPVDDPLGALLSIVLEPAFETLTADNAQLILNLLPPCRDLIGSLVFRVYERVQEGQDYVEHQIAVVQEEATRKIEDIYQIDISVDSCRRANYRVQVENSSGQVLANSQWAPSPIEFDLNCL